MRSQYQLYLSWQRHSWAKVIDCFHLHLSSNTHPSCLMHKHNQLYWHTQSKRCTHIMHPSINPSLWLRTVAHTSCTHPSTPHSDYVQLHTHHAPIYQPLTLSTYSCTHIMHSSINPSLWARTVAHAHIVYTSQKCYNKIHILILLKKLVWLGWFPQENPEG